MPDQNFFDRRLAFTDVETTGTVPGWHEMLELGLVVVDPKQQHILEQRNWKIKPEHLERMDPAAQARNGFTAERWKEAVELKQAISEYSGLTNGAVLWAFNAAFDVGFLKAAFHETQVPNQLDYHFFDVMTLAYPGLRHQNIQKFNLDAVSNWLGIPTEPMPHTAVKGAVQAFEVWKALINKERQ